MDNSTVGDTHGSEASKFHHELSIYIGVSVGAGILLCLIIIIALICYKRRVFRYGGDRRTSARPLFIRGFSTVSQRGVIDSTAEFEIINTHRGSSSSSYPGDQHSQKDGARGSSVTSASGKPPKKPGRKKTRTSSAAVRYENVNIAPRGGVSVGHSDMDIPYMDRTLESRISLDDDVFE